MDDIYIQLIYFCMIFTQGSFSFHMWTPEPFNLTNLFCPDSCIREEKCCVCENKHFWELNGIISDLYIEYISIKDTAVAYQHPNDITQSYARLDHTNGRLRFLPLNICDFPSTVEIRLDHNRLESLNGIDCLRELDSLYLGHNNIETVTNTTFRNLTSLRKLYLNNNNLAIVEPRSFIIGDEGNILNIDLSNNPLKNIDVTNYMFKSFCKVSVSNMENFRLSNDHNFRIQSSKIYGSGGTLELENCTLNSFVSWEHFGLTSWQELYRSLDMAISFSSDLMSCDCYMGYFLSDDLSIESFLKFWQQAEDYVCIRPEELNGTKLTDIFIDHPEKRDLLVCNITQSCPRKCHCFDQPSRDRLVVDCKGRGLTKMPDHMPTRYDHRIELNLADNNIIQMENKPYLSRVVELDISNNQLSEITDEAAFSFPKDAKIKAFGNQLSSVPRQFQNRDPELLNFGHILMSCQCSDSWLKDWVVMHDIGENSTMYICENLNGEKITEINFHNLDCFAQNSVFKYIVGALAAFLFIMIVMAFGRIFFYPELCVIYRKKFRLRLSSCTFKFDAYISFFEEDKKQRMWVMQVMAGHLEKLGYSLFIPVRDTDLAETRDVYLNRKMQDSMNFIVFLSENYFGSSQEKYYSFTQSEFKTILRLYRKDRRRNLIIINFDNLSSGDIHERWAKAFNRVGEVEDFTERHGKILDVIEKKISPPCRQQSHVSNTSDMEIFKVDIDNRNR